MSNTTTLNEALRSPVTGAEFVRLATPGANWKAPLSSFVRTKLSANASYYVSTTGSDSNGGTDPNTDAWATGQHAMDFISQSIDYNGFNIVVQFEDGTYSGFVVNPMTNSRVGDPAQPFLPDLVTLTIQGNSGNVNGVTLTTNTDPNFTGSMIYIPQNESVNIAIRDMTLDGSSLTADAAPLTVTGFAVVNLLGTMQFNGCTVAGQSAGDAINVNAPGGAINVLGTMIFNGGGFDYAYFAFGGAISISGQTQFKNSVFFFGAFVFSGSFSGQPAPFPSSVAFASSATFTGTITSTSFNVQGTTSTLDLTQLGSISVLPGSGWIITDGGTVIYKDSNSLWHSVTGDIDNTGTGAFFQSITDRTAARKSGIPATSDLLPEAWNVYKDTSGGGVYLAYNDAGTIKKVQLT